jgi:hypothetical protein
MLLPLALSLVLLASLSAAASSVPATATASLTPSTTTPTSTKPLPSSTPPANSNSSDTSTVPDVYLNVPQLSVGRIELDVDELTADINLNANVAQLVQINAGVAVSVQKVNITIVDVDAQLELVVRLGHLVDIVSRVFQSLDLNPLLITAINNVTSLVGDIVGAVDGLLGSITQGGTTLNFIVDNLGNIVQEVVGSDGSNVSSIVGNYLTNMTFTGTQQTLSNGDVQKTYSYNPLNALVDIIFNAAGQIVQAVVVKKGGSGGSTSTSTAPVTTATPAKKS